MDLAKLALTGLVGGALALSACTGPAAAPAGDHGHDHAKGDHDHAKATPAETAPAEATPAAAHTEIHDCAGKNTCKGLGGCKVTEASLAEMGTKMGVEGDALGTPHDCKGMNACKGLGGCSVDADKLAALKAKLAEGGADH